MADYRLNDLTDVQLNTLRAQVDYILKERRDRAKIAAIDHFKKAFDYLKKMGVDVYYSEYDDERVELISLEYFEFR